MIRGPNQFQQAQPATTPYFAFGSNLSVEQMRERVGFVGSPRPGKLTGYKLVFNKYAQSRGCGATNLIATGNPNDVVEGIVYDLNQAQLSQLDRHEGAQSNNPQGYKRKSVTLTDGTVANTYIATINNPDPRLTLPNMSYIKLLLAGKKSGFISDDYFIRTLLEIAVQEGGKVKDHINLQDYLPNILVSTSPAPIAAQSAGVMQQSTQKSTENLEADSIIQACGKQLAVVRRLGRGSFATVYLVKDNTGKQYSLKIMHSKPENDNEAQINRKLGRLHGYQKSPSIGEGHYDALLLDHIPGKIMDCFLTDSEICNAVYDGDEVAELSYKQDYLRHPYHGFSSGLARNITFALRLVEAVERIHQKNINHGDMRSRNVVFLEKDGDFAIDMIDFGGSKDVGHNPSRFADEANVMELIKASLPPQAYTEFQRLENASRRGSEQSLSSMKAALEQMLPRTVAQHNPPIQSPAPAPVQHPNAAPPVLIREVRPDPRQNPQAYLEHCVKNGLQIGAVKALNNGARLTPELIARLSDANYRRDNPKTIAALSSFIEAYKSQHVGQRNRIGMG